MARYEQDEFIMKKAVPKTEVKSDTHFIDTHVIRAKIEDLSDELPVAIQALREASTDWAKKDNEMRKAKAKGFLLATGKNKEEREAKADASFEKERLAANIAEGEKNVCMEHVRSLRAAISAWQAMLYANRAENESYRYGQHNQA